jgi:hypothetical protein
MIHNHAIVHTMMKMTHAAGHTATLGNFCREKLLPLFIATLVWLLFLPGLSGGEPAAEIYSNDFNGPPGSAYPEWSSSPITYASSTNPPGSGVLPPPPVSNTDSTNGTQRFLGEFGGPRIGQPGDPGYNHTRVDQTIRLTLNNLPPHTALRVSFDLLVLKSWDGNSPMYGPDHWSLSVAGGPVLLDTTFSNNHKVNKDGSYQNYPQLEAMPRTGAAQTNTLGYRFFGDSIYPLEFTFPHSGSALKLDFHSSLFEGKGLADESWGLDDVRIAIAPHPASAAAGTEPPN